MKAPVYVLGFALAATACGDELVGGDGSNSDGATGGASSGLTSPSGTSSGSQGSSTATGGNPPKTCRARRHALLDDTPCGTLGVADLDADGVDDLYVIEGPIHGFLGSAYVNRRMYSYRGVEALLDTPEIHCCIDAGNPWSATPLDVNGDALDDFVVTAEQDEFSGDVGNSFEEVTLWIRGPAGGFLPRGTVSRTNFGRGHHLAAGRLLTDSPGLAVARKEELWLARPNGTGLATAGEAITLEASTAALGVTDLDGDGIDDLVAMLPESLVLVRSAGDGSLEVQATSTTPILAYSMHLADLDGDGRDDVLLNGADGLAFAQLEAGRPSWSTQNLSTDGPTTLVDIDSDGDLDLATTDGAELLVHLGAGDGTFGEAITLSDALGEDVVDLKTGDFDGDGRSELAACDAQGVLVVQSWT